jgi:hypothetical protein
MRHHGLDRDDDDGRCAVGPQLVADRAHLLHVLDADHGRQVADELALAGRFKIDLQCGNPGGQSHSIRTSARPQIEARPLSGMRA